MPVVAFFCRILLSQGIILIVTFIVHCSLSIDLMCPNIIAFLLYYSDCSIRAFYIVIPKSGTRFCCYWCSEQYSKSSSRHTIVCHAAQEAGTPHVGILTGRKKMLFSHHCISVIPYPIGTKFAAEFPTS